MTRIDNAPAHLSQPLGRFKEMILNVLGESPFYRARCGIDRRDVAHVDLDVLWSRLPLLDAEAVAERPFDFVTGLDRKDIFAIASSSGTTGHSKAIFHADDYAFAEHEQLEYFGIRPGMRAAVIGRYGSLSYVSGTTAYRENGLVVVPMGMGHAPGFYSATIRAAGISIIRCRPAFLQFLAAALRERGEDVVGLGIKHLVLTDHGATPAQLRCLRESFGAAPHLSYGSTEAGPIAFSCREAPGLHVQSSILLELLDPVTLKPCEPGQVGEVVLSTMHNHVMPLLRYRQGDLARFDTAPCNCGMPGRRVVLEGRRGDTFTIGTRGIRVYPARLQAAVAGVPGTSGDVTVSLEGAPGNEILGLTVGLTPGYSRSTESERQVEIAIRGLDHHLARELEAGHIRLCVQILDRSAVSIDPTAKPAYRVEDRRSEGRPLSGAP